MKTIVMYTVFAVLALTAQILKGQEETNEKIELLKAQKEKVLLLEKEALKKEVELINDRLSKGEISKSEAQQLKETAAKKHALNIENATTIIENKIALIERNGSEVISDGNEEIIIGEDSDTGEFTLGIKIGRDKDFKKVYKERRTHSGIVVAIGLNNSIQENKSLDQSDYKIAGSRFFELGYMWTTRIFENSNIARIRYGISYQSNGLKPTDNRYFVDEGNQTNLEVFPLNLNKSKFRQDNLVVPVYLELGASDKIESDYSVRYRTAGKFKIGVGGYVGANISTRQKLKYEENGDDIKDKIKRDYNTNDLIYGLGAYIGFGDTSLYLKYDLNPLFKNAVNEQNNVSLGLRFDW